MEQLLVVDDSVPFLRDVEVLLRDRFGVHTADTAHKALDLLKSEHISAVLLDLMMPDMNGNELLKLIHTQIDPLLPVLIVTDHGKVEDVVTAMQNGAHDFVVKTFNRDILFEKIDKALERRRLELRVHALQNTYEELHDRFVFRNEEMKKIHFEISRLALVDFDILLTGETGVGKDLIAYEIHRRGPRAGKPFLPLAIKAITETLLESELFGHERGAFSGAEKTKPGKLEAAEGGTVYIPEVSSLSEAVQLKLLHFLQYKTVNRVGQDPRKPEMRVDVRIIMASNEDLEQAVGKGLVRGDFFHRISGVKLAVPPLRERPEDIEALAEYFLERHSRRIVGEAHQLAPEVLEAFRKYWWPGNVRELENRIKNALAFSEKRVLTLADFPQFGERAAVLSECGACLSTRTAVLPCYKDAEGNFKRAYFEEILRRSGSRRSKAAAMAGLTTQGLGKILRSLKLEKSL